MQLGGLLLTLFSFQEYFEFLVSRVRISVLGISLAIEGQAVQGESMGLNGSDPHALN